MRVFCKKKGEKMYKGQIGNNAAPVARDFCGGGMGVVGVGVRIPIRPYARHAKNPERAARLTSKLQIAYHGEAFGGDGSIACHAEALAEADKSHGREG